MQLYTYYQSSAAYRVRIALNLKGIAVEEQYVDLMKGEQSTDRYAALNPQKLVPSLVVGEQVLTQSLAIMEYLEEMHPTPPILPREPMARAQARAIALAVAGDISAINNLKVRNRVKALSGIDDATLKSEWIQHWIADGFAAIEALLVRRAQPDPFCVGTFPTIADCCLVPQMFNARRFGCALAPYPTLCGVVAACEALPAFQRAHPSMQPDAPKADA